MRETNAITSASEAFTSGGRSGRASNICFCQYCSTVATGIPSTASENALRTGEAPDWSTGCAGERSPQRVTFMRNSPARSPRRTCVPATEGWTITTKASAAGSGRAPAAIDTARPNSTTRRLMSRES